MADPWDSSALFCMSDRESLLEPLRLGQSQCTVGWCKHTSASLRACSFLRVANHGCHGAGHHNTESSKAWSPTHGWTLPANGQLEQGLSDCLPQHRHGTPMLLPVAKYGDGATVARSMLMGALS